MYIHRQKPNAQLKCYYTINTNYLFMIVTICTGNLNCNRWGSSTVTHLFHRKWLYRKGNDLFKIQNATSLYNFASTLLIFFSVFASNRV